MNSTRAREPGTSQALTWNLMRSLRITPVRTVFRKKARGEPVEARLATLETKHEHRGEVRRVGLRNEHRDLLDSPRALTGRLLNFKVNSLRRQCM